MDHKHAVEVLAEIERLADVNALRAGGLRIWPLLRDELWSKLLCPTSRPATAPTGAPRAASIVGRAEARLRRWREKSRLRSVPRGEALFLSRLEDNGDCIGGEYYNRHTDPMLEFCRARMSCIKIEGSEAGTERTLPRKVATEFLHIQSLGAAPTVLPDLEGAEPVRAALEKIGEPLRFDDEALRSATAKVLHRRDAFRAVLDHLQPRVVFVVCYYDLRVLPLLAACRERGLPTVDIQHGKQGVYHGHYTHWTRFPEGGYELLPDYFWVWGEASQRHIAQGQPANLIRHRPVVGGNRWLALWRKGDAFPPDAEQAAWLADVRAAKRVILVTLQPIDPPIPAAVRDAIQRSPADWLWLLRVHPHRRGDIPKLAAELAGGGRVEFEHASSVPLYALLRVAQRHITCWSSVAFEADAFEVPTMIVHPSGASLYAEDLAAGRFQYTEDAAALIAWIADENPTRANAESYIETDDAHAEAALATILARA